MLELRLSFVDLSKIDIEELLSPLKKLLKLEVDNCNISTLGGIATVAGTLKSLNAADNNFEVFDNDFQTTLGNFLNLKSLDLREVRAKRPWRA